ncbi:MAG: hypothetical protein IT580_08925 [Verrucomicrobiales bacterium]|nr:hypothetical protein [Verrucomicrobiales bacterium]
MVGVVLASGMAALAHQVLWTRRLVDLLGAGPETFSRVVGVFFGGLALGAAWTAWAPPSRSRALAWVVAAEVVVGACGLAVAWIVERGVATGIPAWVITEWGRAVVPGLLVLPASVAMGVVFPALCVALGSEAGPAQLRRWYAWNTVGGLMGLVGVHFVGLPRFGLWGVTVAAGLMNLAAAAGAFWGLRERSTAGHRDAGPQVREVVVDSDPTPVGAPVWLLSLASGFGVLGMEVTLQQQFLQVTINSHTSAVVLLSTVLGGLALAAATSARVKNLGTGLAVTALLCLLEPVWFALLQPGLRIVPYELPHVAYHVRVLGLALATALPVFWASGWLFPSLLARRPGGVSPGMMLAWNGLGGWLGSEVVQGMFLPRFGLWGTMVVLGGGYALGALVLILPRLARTSSGKRDTGIGALPWAVALTVLLALGAAWRFASRQPQVGPSPNERVVEVAVGREGVVAVVTGGTNDWRMLMNNTYTLAGSRAQLSQERQGLLPVLLHGTAHSVALLGFATGSTTAGAALDPAVEELKAFELSPLVAALARRHFAPWNRGVLDDPRVQLVTADARLGVARGAQRYDVVVGDLFLPWRTGEGRLYTSDHFAQVRRSLRPGGLFCQWLPMFQLTRTQFEVITRTFQREFPSAFAVRGDFYAGLPIVGLCGFEDGRGLDGLAWEKVEAACARVREARLEVRDGLMRHAAGVAMLVIGPLPEALPGPVNTLGNAWLEWNAGRSIVGLREPWLVGVPWAEWVRDVHRRGVAVVPEPWRAAHDAGQFYLTLEVAAVSGSRLRTVLEAQVQERLPPALLRDERVDWDRWPATVKPRP